MLIERWLARLEIPGATFQGPERAQPNPADTGAGPMILTGFQKLKVMELWTVWYYQGLSHVTSLKRHLHSSWFWMIQWAKKIQPNSDDSHSLTCNISPGLLAVQIEAPVHNSIEISLELYACCLTAFRTEI